MKQFLLLLIFLSCLVASHAQIISNNALWMQYVEGLAESGEKESAEIEGLFDELSYLSEHPFNINSITKEDLQRLPFLSDKQIESLLFYLYRYAPLASIYELGNVDDWDWQTIALFLPFVVVGKEEKKQNPNLSQMLRYGKQEITIRSDYCLQEKAGYASVADEERIARPNKYYLGEPYYLSLRYDFSYKEQIQFGFCGEKDAGEPFWNDYHRGFDYSSFHLTLRNTGIIRGLYLGDYKLSFGQGLVVNNDFSIGKTSDVTNVNKKNRGFKRHFSTNESDYLRGAASTLKICNSLIDFFYSHRRVDANTDSSTILSFKTDGYHRVPNDRKKQRQAEVNTFGTNYDWSNETFSLGASFLYYSFGGKDLNPSPKPYNLFYLRGRDNYNYGIHYGFQLKNCFFQGETASGANGGIATLNTLTIAPASFFQWTLSYRNYSRHYQALYGRTFSEATGVQNENGLYLGLKTQFLRHWKIDGYFDFFRFPWLKSGNDTPSSGKEGLIQTSYIKDTQLQALVRYKYKDKNGIRHRWKAQTSYRMNKNFVFKSQFDCNRRNHETVEGWAISQTIGYINPQSTLQIDGALSWFYTRDWNSRISIYEKNPLYSYNYPAFYGKGLRFYTMLKWKANSKLTMFLKASNSHYYDRDSIGSELEFIDGNNKTDINYLIRISF